MALETRSWFGCSLTMAIGFASVFGAGPARAASAGAIDSVQIFPRVAQVPDRANQTYQVLAFDSLGKKVALNGASVSWSLVPTKGCPAPAGSLRVQTQPASAVYAAPATGNAGKCPDALAVKVSSLGQSVSATASAAFFVNDPTMYTNLQGVLYDKTHSPSPYAELVLTGGGPGSVCQHCTIIADSNGAINAWVTRSREYFATIGLLTAGGGYATYVPDVALFWSHAAAQRIQDFVATSTLAVGGSGTAKTAWEYFVRDSIKIWESTEGGTGSGQVSLASGGFQTTDLAYLLTHPTPGQSGRLASGEAGSGRSSFNTYLWNASGTALVLYYPDSSASRYFAQINVTGTPAYGKCQAGDVLCYDETVFYTPITVSGSYVWQSPLATLPAGAGVYSKSSEAVALSATNYSKTVTDASGVKYAIAENLVTKAVTVRTPVFTYSAVPDGATGYDYTSSGSIFGYNFTITGQNNGLPHPQVAGKFTVTDTGSGAYGGESITWTTTPTVQTGVYTNPYDPSLNQSCTIPWTSQQVTCTNATTGEVISWHI